jgi:aspartyl-tRNA(Asn)/glutamyl-tRNA(Gln) amidotransferase subunit B
MNPAEKIGLEPVIGLEVHAQLLTASKMFCGCRAAYGEPPNSLTCPVCLGHPGTLPVLNRQAVKFAVKTILALGGQVQHRSVFARKNYFYPDLPKGYQISQYDRPIGLGGKLSIDLGGITREIRLIRIHLEEDAGKSLHPEGEETFSRIDLNRCGIPLLEIVTQPEIHSPEEAREFLIKLKRILQYLGICSGNMEKGALRCDANISLRRQGTVAPGTRTELKNLNSFRAVARALAYEMKRQTGILNSSGEVIQETRFWDDVAEKTESMRGKEESEDYRYFPEPDLTACEIDREIIESVRSILPELPDAKKERLMSEYGLSAYDAGIMTDSLAVADYFEGVAKKIGSKKLAANWVMVEVLRALKEKNIEICDFNLSSDLLSELLLSVESNIISGKMAKDIFEEMVISGRRASEIIDQKGIRQITLREELVPIIDKVLNTEREQVEKYKDGKTRLFGYFVGKVMEATAGRANPELVNEILREKLDGR